MKNTCPVPKGVLLIIGGKEDKGQDQTEKEKPDTFVPQEILRAFYDIIGKRNPRIEIVTSGSNEGKASFNDYVKAFRHMGKVNLGHIHHNVRTEIREEELAECVKRADGIFLAGGDQLKLTSLYGGTAFLVKLKEKYIDRKFVLAGTSAGAMAMSTPMIYAGNQEVHDIAGKIKITTGLEFMKDVCIDTHFENRNRFIRLAQVIATNPTCIGLGLAEDTAVVVREGVNLEVIGSGMATIIEGFHITDANYESYTENLLVSIRDLNVHLISKGDKFKVRQMNPHHA